MLSVFVFTPTPFERVKLDPPACTPKLCHAGQLTGTDLPRSCETTDLRQKSNTADSSWVTGGEECVGSDVRKPYRCPEMVSNSPSLSGSSEGKQRRLRRKKDITLVQKIWLFLSFHRRRHREKCGRKQGNLDMRFGSFSRLNRSKLCHGTTKPIGCFC